MLPAGQIDKGFVNPLKYKYNSGDKINVKYYGKNPTTGKLMISHKTSSNINVQGVGEARIAATIEETSCEAQNATSNKGNSPEHPEPTTILHATFNASGTVVLSDTVTKDKKEPLKEQEQEQEKVRLSV